MDHRDDYMRIMDALELQDKLIIIYKGMQQRRSFEKFFGKDKSLDNDFLDRLIEMDADDLIRDAIVELEDLIRRDSYSLEECSDPFDSIVNREALEYKCMRYGIRGPEGIKLEDIECVLSRV
ncbi:hypothetical protein DNK57_07705 [Methanothermobacter thermautotrophicus]|uniref:Uncharacterized protein n=2 Tax=Methanothermobacter thermautotrophicus TaxID=145262 RepID=A0A842YQM6_METTF|nr:hypothetical protein [Methanothermobacter thermautotrophicus]